MKPWILACRPLPLATLLALPACADPWEEARAACDLDAAEPFAWDAIYGATDGGRNGLPVSRTCAETVLAHLGGDPDVLLEGVGAEGDLGEHVEAVRTGAAPVDGVAAAVWGMVWLAGGDYRTVGDLSADAFVAQAWVDRVRSKAEGLGLDDDAPLGHVLYDDVAARSAGVDFFPDDAPFNAGMAMQSWPADVLHVARAFDTELPWVVAPWRPDVAAAGLFHEAHHAALDGIPHVECEAPAVMEGRFCDADTDGTYGATFLVMWAEAAAAKEAWCVERDAAAGQVLEDAALDIRATWGDLLMSELPETPVWECG